MIIAFPFSYHEGFFHLHAGLGSILSPAPSFEMTIAAALSPVQAVLLFLCPPLPRKNFQKIKIRA